MKKIPLIALGLLSFLLIPLDFLIKDVPKLLAIICLAALVLSNILLIMDKKTSKIAKTLLSILGGIVVLGLTVFTFFNPYFNSLTFRANASYYSIGYRETITAGQVEEDLDYVINAVKRVHPALRNGLPDDMQKELDKARAAIHSEVSFTPEKAARIIEPVLATLHDGHTMLNANFPEWHNYWFFYENDSLNLVGINGQSIDDFFKENSYLISYDHPAYGKQEVFNLITALEGLEYYGIDAGAGVTYNFEDPDGNPVDKFASGEDFLTYNEYIEKFNITLSDSSSQESDEYKFAYYDIDESVSLGLFTLDSCKYNQEYIDLVNDFFTEVKEKGIKNVCFDLRHNGGGNSLVANEVIKYFDVDSYGEFTCTARFGPLLMDMGSETRKNNRKDNLTFTGDFYVLTSTSSFSSAMDFAMYIKDNHLGTIIGEEPGNDPNGYGDVVNFATPNAHLYFQVSYKKWNRIDRNATDKYITPDIPCPASEALNTLYDTINK